MIAEETEEVGRYQRSKPARHAVHQRACPEINKRIRVIRQQGNEKIHSVKVLIKRELVTHHQRV